MSTSAAAATATAPSTARVATVPVVEPSTQSTPSTQSVRVVEQASSVEPSTIPDRVREFFAGRGFRMVPACVMPLEINRRSRHRSHPLRVSEVTNELPSDDGKWIRRALHEAGFTEKDDMFRRSDTTIFMQPHEEYLRRGEEARLDWLRRMPNDATAAATIADVAGEDLIRTNLVSVYTREEMNRRTQ